MLYIKLSISGPYSLFLQRRNFAIGLSIPRILIAKMQQCAQNPGAFLGFTGII